MTSPVDDSDWNRLLETRLRAPHELIDAIRNRKRRPLLGDDGHIFLLAVDHPARNTVAVHDNPLAMSDRRDLLERTIQALRHKRVDGVMATPDILEELALLGALENKLAVGSINRGGLANSVWEMNDPITAATPKSIIADGLDGGKVLLRINESDANTLHTIKMVADVVSEMAEAGLPTIIEPLPYHTVAKRQQLHKDDNALIRAIGVASGLGSRSAYTWLKLPVWSKSTEVMTATSMPVVLLGGAPSNDLTADMQLWGQALQSPQVRGYVIGRSLLYPKDNNVNKAVTAAAEILQHSILVKEKSNKTKNDGLTDQGSK